MPEPLCTPQSLIAAITSFLREVAAAARRTIQSAQHRVQRGDVLLVFAEGTRSRTGGIQPLLTGLARYFEVPGARVVPVGITGSKFLFPIGEGTLDGIPPAQAPSGGTQVR